MFHSCDLSDRAGELHPAFSVGLELTLAFGSEVIVPASSLTALRARPVPSLTAVTFAPGTAAPDSSVTVPVTLPYRGCASTEAGTAAIASASNTALHDVVDTLVSRPGHQHVVITGRRADPALIEAADLVVEMTKIKHPMDAGQKGQRGIEW